MRLDPTANPTATRLPITVLVFHDGPMTGRAKPLRGHPCTDRPLIATHPTTRTATLYTCRQVALQRWDLTSRGLPAATYETFHYWPASGDDLRT